MLLWAGWDQSWIPSRLAAEWRSLAKRKPYMVYHHIVNGAVIYVGMGKGYRAFNLTGRSNVWFSAAGSSRLVRVHIVRRFSDRRKALAYEGRDIRALRPVANLKIPKEKK